jgi:hypothetical protein
MAIYDNHRVPQLPIMRFTTFLVEKSGPKIKSAAVGGTYGFWNPDLFLFIFGRSHCSGRPAKSATKRHYVIRSAVE